MVSEKVIIILLLIAIVFSVGSTIINLSLLNFELESINIKIPAQQVEGNPNGNLNLYIEGNPNTGNVVSENNKNGN